MTEAACNEVTKLETETCGRCSGSGRYSYNQMHGSVCYGCGGKGIRYTKRGAAAAQFLETLRSVRLDSLKVGDIMRIEATTPNGTGYRYFATVTDTGPETSTKTLDHATGEWVPYAGLRVVTSHPKFGESGLTAPGGYMVRKGFSAEEKAAQFRQALDYQATLTKTGKPKKVRGA